MDEDRLRFLLKSYADNLAKPKEVEELLGFLKTAEPDEHLKKMFVQSIIRAEPEIILSEESWNKIWNSIRAKTFQPERKKAQVHVLSGNIAVAVLMIIVGIGGFFIWDKKKQDIPVTVKRTLRKNDISPGGNRAILTLADGTSIALDTAKNGYLTNQRNTKITKVNTGLLSYKNGEKNAGKIMYNTITTPRGAQYELELADGTGVWLNSASSLTFPTAFQGKERRVVLKGEGYFEVTKNTSMPFHVTINTIDVKVLGTHFNIMGYSDEENINTTLLEGKVYVTLNNVTKSLLPGNEAVLNKTTSHFEISKANISQAIAWKNGEFRFKDMGIKELMRQVGRWYDVDVEYRTPATGQVFNASLPRMSNVSALLQTLELTGTVHFKIENKKIIVLP